MWVQPGQACLSDRQAFTLKLANLELLFNLTCRKPEYLELLTQAQGAQTPQPTLLLSDDGALQETS